MLEKVGSDPRRFLDGIIDGVKMDASLQRPLQNFRTNWEFRGAPRG